MILDEILDNNQFKKMLKIAAQDVIKARGFGDIESYLEELAKRDFDEFQDVLVCEDMPAIAVAGILQQAFDKAGKMWNMFPDFDYYDPDASYYEDLHAFVSSFVDWAKE